jgi:predicted nucleic acid-binding protein
LYASVDADDQDHERSLAVLQRSDLDLVVPALAVAEVTYVTLDQRHFAAIRPADGTSFRLLPD